MMLKIYLIIVLLNILVSQLTVMRVKFLLTEEKKDELKNRKKNLFIGYSRLGILILIPIVNIIVLLVFLDMYLLMSDEELLKNIKLK